MRAKNQPSSSACARRARSRSSRFALDSAAGMQYHSILALLGQRCYISHMLSTPVRQRHLDDRLGRILALSRAGGPLLLGGASRTGAVLLAHPAPPRRPRPARRRPPDLVVVVRPPLCAERGTRCRLSRSREGAVAGHARPELQCTSVKER